MKTKMVLGAAVLVLLLLASVAYELIWRRVNEEPTFFTKRPGAARLSVGQSAPAFTLPRIGGGEYSLSEVKDKIILVNFWASWCEPCTREFPSLLKLVQKLEGRVELVAISIDSRKGDVENFLKAFDGHGPYLSVLWDPANRIAGLYGTDQYPETYILDRDHRLVRKISGMEDWSRPDILFFLRHLAQIPTPD